MLSRVADSLYWFSRYVRRAENLARLVSVGSQMQLDMPRGTQFTWRPLVDTLGVSETFERTCADRDTVTEADVVRFLLIDASHPVAIRAVVLRAREILRTVREALPQECWMAINNLHLYIEAHAERADHRRDRQAFLDRVVDVCMHINALLAANMSRDTGYHFLRLGAAIEQADMTSRIMDVAGAGLIQSTQRPDRETFQIIQWISVLQSLAAYQMYRRQLRQRVTAPMALQFLLKDREFPRSVMFCVWRMQAILPFMPKRAPVQEAFRSALGMILDANPLTWDETRPRLFMDAFQIALVHVHEAVEASYFRS
jgi:uncharacterized alpha-E superfamily protein